MRAQGSCGQYPPHVRPLLLYLSLAACSQPMDAPVPLDASGFDSERAWADLMYQVDELGPRPAGSKTLEETRSWIFKELEGMGLSPIREEFQADTPFGMYRMANIYADFATDAANQNTTHQDKDVARLEGHMHSNDQGEQPQTHQYRISEVLVQILAEDKT